LWSWHVGVLVPQGNWFADNVEVRAPTWGRPRAAVGVAADAARLVALVGGVRAAARAAGCDEKSIRLARDGRAVSTVLATRIRAVHIRSPPLPPVPRAIALRQPM